LKLEIVHGAMCSDWKIAAYSVDVWERGCAKMANRTGRYGEVRCRRFSAPSTPVTDVGLWQILLQKSVASFFGR
jgi:hypothetical protein